MIRKVFSIKDAKAEVYNPPICRLTHGEAERDFRAMANEKDTKIGMFPQDFDLYYLGDYDDSTGKLISLDTPQHITKAADLVKSSSLQ